MTPAAARESAGLTVSEAARRIGCARYTLARWEARRQTPNAVHLLRLAEVYALPNDCLLDLARYWSDHE